MYNVANVIGHDTGSYGIRQTTVDTLYPNFTRPVISPS